jgi:hypothetical protein
MDYLQIGGQNWRAVKRSTIEHDFWLMKHIREAGLDAVRLRPGEKPEEFAVRLLHEVIGSGRAFTLLGGMLLPDGVPDEHWSPERAEQTAAIMRSLSADEDKAAVTSAIISLLTGFLEAGLRSYANSVTVSTAGSQPQPEQPQPPAFVPVPPY